MSVSIIMYAYGALSSSFCREMLVAYIEIIHNDSVSVVGSKGSTDNISLTLMTSFPLQIHPWALLYALRFGSLVRADPSLETTTDPPPSPRTDRWLLHRSNWLVMNAHDLCCLETRPCLRPSSGSS